MMDEKERALRAYKRQRLVKGPMGQPVVHPMLKVANDLEDRIVRAEDRFGLSPMARLKLGITYETFKSLDQMNREMNYDLERDEDPRKAITVDAEVTQA
jgi:phage terminase small subunit